MVSVDVKQLDIANYAHAGTGLSLSLICQQTSEDIKHHLKKGRQSERLSLRSEQTPSTGLRHPSFLGARCRKAMLGLCAQSSGAVSERRGGRPGLSILTSLVVSVSTHAMVSASPLYVNRHPRTLRNTTAAAKSLRAQDSAIWQKPDQNRNQRFSQFTITLCTKPYSTIIINIRQM